MTVHSAVEVTLPEAALLAELWSIQKDLSEARALTQHVLASDRIDIEVGNQYLDARESHTRDAIILYFRCFSGLRYKLDPFKITTFDQATLEVHQYLFELRNKFISHPVNPFEEYRVTVVASGEGEDRRLGTNVSFGYGGRLIREAEAEQLQVVIDKALEWLAPVIDSEKQKLEALIANLPRSVTDAWEVAIAGTFPRSQVSTRRSPRGRR